ncbi:transporter [uncultured Sphingomonas sp.]|uniref:transporter n=1 Tax=uncultured Sphingomonas sp. TaxID=158754 RepID=UPI0025FAE02C|nr:transporter [uncultured Sphingomonas sp.]
MKTLIAATGLAMLVAVPASAQVTASIGADYASGKYGTGQQVRSASSTFALRAKRKRVTVFAALPVVQVDAPGNVIAPGGPLGLPIFTDPTRPATRERRSGLGDAVVGASVQVIPPRRHHLALALTGSAKLPTASAARGLGTGKADYSVVAEAAVPGKVTPFAAVGHSFVGQPDGYRLRDVTSARGGVAVGLGKASEVSVSYNYASRVSDQVADRQEIGAGLDTALSQRLSLGLQGSAGVSKGAPDVGAGVRLGLRL